MNGKNFLIMEIPTLEEVKLRAKRKYLYVKAEDFYNYHEKNGWKVKNWKISLGLWELKAKKNQPPCKFYICTGIAIKKRY